MLTWVRREYNEGVADGTQDVILRNHVVDLLDLDDLDLL